MAQPTFAMDPFIQAFGQKRGLYYGPNMTDFTTVSPTLNALRVMPFLVSRPTTYDRIGLDVTTGGSAGALQRLGVYNSHPDTAYPNELVLDAGTIDATLTQFSEILTNLALSQGLYWIGAVPQVATSGVRIGTGQAIIPIGASSGSSITTRGYEHPNVTSALPALFSTTVTVITQSPRVMLRAA